MKCILYPKHYQNEQKESIVNCTKVLVYHRPIDHPLATNCQTQSGQKICEIPLIVLIGNVLAKLIDECLFDQKFLMRINVKFGKRTSKCCKKLKNLPCLLLFSRISKEENRICFNKGWAASDRSKKLV